MIELCKKLGGICYKIRSFLLKKQGRNCEAIEMKLERIQEEMRQDLERIFNVRKIHRNFLRSTNVPFQCPLAEFWSEYYITNHIKLPQTSVEINSCIFSVLRNTFSQTKFVLPKYFLDYIQSCLLFVFKRVKFDI